VGRVLRSTSSRLSRCLAIEPTIHAASKSPRLAASCRVGLVSMYTAMSAPNLVGAFAFPNCDSVQSHSTSDRVSASRAIRKPLDGHTSRTSQAGSTRNRSAESTPWIRGKTVSSKQASGRRFVFASTEPHQSLSSPSYLSCYDQLTLAKLAAMYRRRGVIGGFLKAAGGADHRQSRA
jgi:hypothetical protein